MNSLTESICAALAAHPHATALAVTDGIIKVGTIVDTQRRGVRSAPVFAFDSAGVLLGEYRTRQAAMAALPRAGSSAFLAASVKDSHSARLGVKQLNQAASRNFGTVA